MKTQFLRAWVCTLLCGIAIPQSEAPHRATAIKAHLQRAEAALRANDVETASREFRAALTLDPKNPEAHTNLGIIAFFRADCQAESANLRQALSVNPPLAYTQP